MQLEDTDWQTAADTALCTEHFYQNKLHLSDRFRVPLLRRDRLFDQADRSGSTSSAVGSETALKTVVMLLLACGMGPLIAQAAAAKKRPRLRQGRRAAARVQEPSSPPGTLLRSLRSCAGRTLRGLRALGQRAPATARGATPAGRNADRQPPATPPLQLGGAAVQRGSAQAVRGGGGPSGGMNMSRRAARRQAAPPAMPPPRAGPAPSEDPAEEMQSTEAAVEAAAALNETAAQRAVKAQQQAADAQRVAEAERFLEAQRVAEAHWAAKAERQVEAQRQAEVQLQPLDPADGGSNGTGEDDAMDLASRPVAGQCCVCLDAWADSVIMPCGHVVAWCVSPPAGLPNAPAANVRQLKDSPCCLRPSSSSSISQQGVPRAGGGGRNAPRTSLVPILPRADQACCRPHDDRIEAGGRLRCRASQTRGRRLKET